MELTKPGLLILVIIGSVAVCHCGPTSTCPLVGVRVNGQTINKPPRHKDVLCYAQQNSNGGIKFSYWTNPIGPKLKDLSKLDYVFVAKSKEVKLKDMPSIITVEGIYGESPKTFKGLNQLEELDQPYVEKSKEVNFDDLRKEISKEITLKCMTSDGSSIKGKSSGTDRDMSDIKRKKISKSMNQEGRRHKFKNLFLCGSGTDRDTLDSKHKRSSRRSRSSSRRGSSSGSQEQERVRSRSSSGRGSSVRRGSRSGSQERLINPKSADNINRGSSSGRGSQSYNIEPDNCENEEVTFFKLGRSQSSIEPNNCENVKRFFLKIGIRTYRPTLNPTNVFIIYLPLIENSKYSCSIGYLRENQERKNYPLPPIAKGVQKFLMLTLAEDGKIIQDGFALSADITNSLLEVKDITKQLVVWSYDVPDVFLRRKNQDQKFPEELFFERTNKSTGVVDKIRYKYDDVAGEHDPVHKLDLPANQQRARYIGTWLKFKM